MEHPGPEHDVPPYTSLQANRPEHRGAAQGGERISAPRQPADPTPPAAQVITTALALDSNIPIRAPGRQWMCGARGATAAACALRRSEEHTSELQSLMRNSYAGFCLKKKNNRTECTTT